MAHFTLTRRSVIFSAAASLLLSPRALAQDTLTLRAEAGTNGARFNNAGIGPELHLERGKAFSLTIENRLDHVFRFRTQGLRGAALQGADEPIAPSETRAVTITPPDAGTFAYYAVTHDERAAAVQTLCGVLVVQGDEPSIAAREIVLGVNTLDDTQTDSAHLSVNGETSITIKAAPRERLRLRIVNLSPSVPAGLYIPAGAHVIAVDGQPCDPFPPYGEVLFLPPLGRNDVLIDMPEMHGAQLTLVDAFDPSTTLVTLTSEGEAAPEARWETRLPDNPALPAQIPFQNATRITWDAYSAIDTLTRVKTGISVVLTIKADDRPRALAVDGLTMRLLDALDDGWKPWWHDALIIPPQETLRLAFRPDTPGAFSIRPPHTRRRADEKRDFSGSYSVRLIPACKIADAEAPVSEHPADLPRSAPALSGQLLHHAAIRLRKRLRNLSCPAPEAR